MSENESRASGHDWERLAGHDFREDIPPSFEWWRKFVYEPGQQRLTDSIENNRAQLMTEMEQMNRKVDGQAKLLWGVLVVNMTGMIGVITVLITHH